MAKPPPPRPAPPRPARPDVIDLSDPHAAPTRVVDMSEVVAEEQRTSALPHAPEPPTAPDWPRPDAPERVSIADEDDDEHSAPTKVTESPFDDSDSTVIASATKLIEQTERDGDEDDEDSTRVAYIAEQAADADPRSLGSRGAGPSSGRTNTPSFEIRTPDASGKLRAVNADASGKFTRQSQPPPQSAGRPLPASVRRSAAQNELVPYLAVSGAIVLVALGVAAARVFGWF